MHRYPQPIAPLSQNQQMQCNHHGVTSRIAIDSAIVGKVCFTISEMRETSRFRTVNGWWSELASTLSRDGPYAQLARLSLYTDQERSSRHPCPWHLLLHRAIHISSRYKSGLMRRWSSSASKVCGSILGRRPPVRLGARGAPKACMLARTLRTVRILQQAIWAISLSHSKLDRTMSYN